MKKNQHFETGMSFTDKYGRRYFIAEIIKRESETGEKYILYNLYPQKVQPEIVKHEWDKNRGFHFEPYLEVLEEGLKNIIE